jgi:hypothetical protein
MQHMRFTAPQFGVGKSLPPGDGLEGERGDEFLRGGGENHIHLRPGLGQFGGQFGGLIGGDGTGDTEDDMFGGEDGHNKVIIMPTCNP